MKINANSNKQKKGIRMTNNTLEEWIKIGFVIEIAHDNLDGYEVRAIRGRETYSSDRSEWLDLAIESLTRRLKREASIEE